ncbi:hypothetical protein WG947_00520 [Pontibacter sp. H259]|uniref:hypothetical protein n=1 Tax=Pontibacter sp. H259 TaxID=3133421 RepID=UPI0030C469D9
MNKLYMNAEAILRVCFILLFILCVNFNLLAQDDEWGTGSAAEPEEIPIVDDQKVELVDGMKVYTIFVQNGTTETLIIRNPKLNSIKLGDVAYANSKVKVELPFGSTIRVLPGEQKNLLVVRGKTESKDLVIRWNYNYFTLSAASVETGKPTAGIDFGVYSEVDSTTKHVTYFAHNFTDKPLELKGVKEYEEDDYGMDWSRNSVMTGTKAGFYKSKTIYSGPEKPITIAPGKAVMVWKDAYMNYEYYPYISPVLDIDNTTTRSKTSGN